MQRLWIPMMVLLVAGQAMAQVPQVMPGNGKPYEVFAQDQNVCRQFAADQMRGSSGDELQHGVVDTLIGAALGAGLGAAAGGGHGAGLGAAVGGGVGALVGVGDAAQTNRAQQYQYNSTYVQCMSAKGNFVTMSAPMTYAPSVPYGYTPPPPPGFPPPP